MRPVAALRASPGRTGALARLSSFIEELRMPIIDAHAHTNGGNLGNYKAGLLASRALGRGDYHQNEDQLRTAVQHHMTTILDKVGTDIQFVSPRPFQLMHSESPTKIVHYYCQ